MIRETTLRSIDLDSVSERNACFFRKHGSILDSNI